MSAVHPVVEAPAPGVLSIRYEWPEQLAPQWQRELVERARASSAAGPVGLAFVLAPRICEIAPNVRGFWRRVVSDPQLRLAAFAVITTSWAVEVEARGFGITNSLSGARLRVETFGDEAEAMAWLVGTLRLQQPA
jgi:hypothetical protein